MPRQCGSRIAGGIYLSSELSPFGYPLEYFLRDEPVVVDLDELGLTARGVQVRDIRTNCAACNPHNLEESAVSCPYCGEGRGWLSMPHVFDVVGKQYYPNVWDFVEETRALGASRRAELPPEEYARLRPGSRLILIHERAWVDNSAAYFERIGSAGINDAFSCPKRIAPHDELTRPPKIDSASPRCARVWRYDLDEDGTELVEHQGLAEDSGLTLVDRPLACGTQYRSFLRPAGIEPDYRHAIFMALPIHRIELVDPAREADDKLRKLTGAQLPVSIADF